MKKIFLILTLFIFSCDEAEVDCKGVLGGTAIEDDCGLCDGDNSTCIGCDDLNACNYLPNPLIEVSCEYPEPGYTCNSSCEVGYSKYPDFWNGNYTNSICYNNSDISFLQSLINNSSETLLVDKLDWYNNNNIVEWYEIGYQEWEDSRLTYFSTNFTPNPSTNTISYNAQLSNSIPNIDGSLEKIITLDLGGPRDANLDGLEGSIPEKIYNLPNLEILYLNRNSLSGGIESSISNLSKLKELWISNNNFSGNIPDELWSLDSLYGLWLDHNDFNGAINSLIGEAVNLRHLLINNNNFSGIISQEICDLSLPYSNLDYTYIWVEEGEPWKIFNISGNKFCPPFPDCIENHVGTQDDSNCP